MPRVMISYRRINGQSEFAASLEKELSAAGFDTWFDQNNIPAGSKWEDEIFKGVIESDYVILCLSPEYLESQYCLFECYIARGYGKRLLPIIVPYDESVSVFDLIGSHEETRGIDHLNILSFNPREILGLVEDYLTLVRRLIKPIIDPTPIDVDYDVYFTYRWRQAHFATQIADDLNAAGIKSFIHTRAIDVGADWRRVSWSAMLRAKSCIVILSPDVSDSEYIKNEVLVMRTKKNTQFIPVLAQEYADHKDAISEISRGFRNSKNLSVLSDIQWYIPNRGYSVLIDTLIADITAKTSRSNG